MRVSRGADRPCGSRRGRPTGTPRRSPHLIVLCFILFTVLTFFCDFNFIFSNLFVTKQIDLFFLKQISLTQWEAVFACCKVIKHANFWLKIYVGLLDSLTPIALLISYAELSRTGCIGFETCPRDSSNWKWYPTPPPSCARQFLFFSSHWTTWLRGPLLYRPFSPITLWWVRRVLDQHWGFL